MKLSRVVIRAGLLLVTAAFPFIANAPRIALWLADAGDKLSAFGVKLMCYGH